MSGKSARATPAVKTASSVTSPRSLLGGAPGPSVSADAPVRPATSVPATPAVSAPAPESAFFSPGVVQVLAEAAEPLRSTAMQARTAVIRWEGDLLGWAIASHREQLVEGMLAAGVNVNARDSAGMTPLLHAVMAESWGLAARLLARGAEPDASGPQQVTALMLAASAGQMELIAALLQSGAQVDVADAKGQRALHYALTTRKLEAVKALLAAKARVSNPDVFPLAAETRDWNFIGPVLECSAPRPWDLPARELVAQAVRAKDVEHLRLLFSKHKGPVALAGSKDPLLAHAVVRNDLALARLLLQAGADPNTTLPGKPEPGLLNLVPGRILKHYLMEEPGMTVTIVAAGMGHNDMLRLLIAFGAEKNRPTKSKYRLVPLYFAAWENHVSCLQTLIDNAPPPEQMRVEISLTTQQATLYKNGVPIFQTEISSGQPGTPTPTGQFVVTDKKRYHMSTIYPARMPFFMRLSCKDFGMHEGELPGYPASHGCIRLSGEAARKMFKDVPMGTLVTIR